MDEKGLYISSYENFFKYMPNAIEDAISDGAGGAQGILIHIMRRAFPRVEWPPNEESPVYPQWRSMIYLVAEGLNIEPEPEPEPTKQNKKFFIVK
jgi:hypothetical protein